MSISFTSLALWTSHTSEVTSEHASPQPGVKKSSRQWKTGEEKWLNGSLYSYWCLTHRWYHLSPEGVYEEILMYFIHYIWKCRLLISCEHFYMNNQYMDYFIYMWSFIVYFNACYFKLFTLFHFMPQLRLEIKEKTSILADHVISVHNYYFCFIQLCVWFNWPTENVFLLVTVLTKTSVYILIDCVI